MSSWILVPCLVSLRAELNALAPSRDKASDGSIGNTAHAQESSDHNPDETGNTPYEDADNLNEVHAIDVDDDLRKAGWTMDKCLEIIITRHRDGRDNRLQNVIYNRRIWSRSWGWTARAYTGASAHTEHAHFSARYTTAQEGDTRPWGLLALLQEDEDDMATISQTDFNARMDAWWLARMAPNAANNPQRTALRVAPWQQEVGHTGISTHDQLFGAMLALLQTAAGQQVDVDEDAIAAAVLASLTPEKIVAGIPAGIAQQVVALLGQRMQA
jgi:hypothetical protein